MSQTYSLGIDLGTSNSVAALIGAGGGEVGIVPVTQVLTADGVGERETLPSAIYLPQADEFAPEALRLPWEDEGGEMIVGAFALEHGALVPDRLITSAKSWLCRNHVDRRARILPWKSELTEVKLSPVDASRRYLKHLRDNLLFHRSEEAGPEAFKITLTVPASFDEVARALTREAAEAAGFRDVTLLEEPQAALYAWLAETGDRWREQIQPGDIVLVCDVGGGTADFSLIAVSEEDGNLRLDRVSVGDHILLGGDNMDLALAYTVRAGLEEEGKSIDERQFMALVQGCRQGKEKLFGDPDLSSFPISLPGRGSGLFAGTVATALLREQLTAVVLDGFLPVTPISDQPVRGRSAGLQEFGLDYAGDPVISKHLARFLTRSLQNVRSNERLVQLVGESSTGETTFLRPTAILFNGGVFNAEPIRRRATELLSHWSGGEPIKELTGGHLDLSVAKGAAYYGTLSLSGEGIRIRAGTARSYYVGLESSMPAVPGYKPPVKGVCVVPQGMEEGTEAELGDREFGLVTGEAVTFRFFSSTVRAGDTIGSLVADAEKELEETSALQVTLEALEDGKQGEVVPVRLHSAVTELGTLELWMRHEASGKEWKLEFDVRGDKYAAPGSSSVG